MPAGNHKTIVDTVVTEVESITPFAVAGTPAPTVFRKNKTPSLEGSQSRQFDVLITDFVRRQDTGCDATTADVERAMLFEVRVRFINGSQPTTDFYSVILEDTRRIQDRVVRAVLALGGGVTACRTEGAAVTLPGEAPQVLYVNIPFAAEWLEAEYVTGA